MPPPPLEPIWLWFDFALTAVAVIFCLLIYFRTKELYDLTKHKGIAYFRSAFLFFGLSSLLRFIFMVVMLTSFTLNLRFARPAMLPFSALLLSYFSTISILYLLRAAVWKDLPDRKVMLFGHALAIILSVVAFITRSHYVLLFVQCTLIFYGALMVFFTKKGMQIKLLYLLIGLLWLVNLIVIGRHRPFIEIELVTEAITIVILAVLYWRVRKWSG